VPKNTTIADDYTLTIEEVSRRLNKSTRTIHRYKDGGKLSFVMGTTQGNPLFFSRSEVEALALELYPAMQPATGVPAADPKFWDRLDRLEKLLGVLERNPLLERVVSMARGLQDENANQEFEEALQQLAALEGSGNLVDRQELGRVLVRLGSALLNA
jgi:hypothetical protein